jgi:hypothetical protein
VFFTDNNHIHKSSFLAATLKDIFSVTGTRYHATMSIVPDGLVIEFEADCALEVLLVADASKS